MSHAKAGPGMPPIETPPDAARSAVMRAIRRSGTKPERVLGAALRRLGLRPIAQDRRRPGTPDFSFPSARVAVFVDGAFWHGRARLPKTNAAWWAEKFRRNRARDRRANRALRAAGWLAFRFGERDALRAPDALAGYVAGVIACRKRGRRAA